MSRVCGAGILPYFVCGGQVLFLLAKEKHVPGWRGSSKISAFEGGHKAFESIEHNAVREFIEESMSLLCRSTKDVESLKTQITQGDYAMKIGVFQNDEQHWTYVKRFEYTGEVDDLPAIFQARRALLQKTQEILNKVSASENALPKRYPFHTPGDVVIMSRELRLKSAEITHQSDQTLSVQYNFIDVEDNACSRTVSFALNRQMSTYANSIKDRISLRENIKKLPVVLSSLAITRRRDGNDHISGEWLEKQSIGLYSLRDIKMMLLHHPDAFRPYFIYVIRQVVQQFTTPSPPNSLVTMHLE